MTLELPVGLHKFSHKKEKICDVFFLVFWVFFFFLFNFRHKSNLVRFRK